MLDHATGIYWEIQLGYIDTTGRHIPIDPKPGIMQPIHLHSLDQFGMYVFLTGIPTILRPLLSNRPGVCELLELLGRVKQ